MIIGIANGGKFPPWQWLILAASLLSLPIRAGIVEGNQVSRKQASARFPEFMWISVIAVWAVCLSSATGAAAADNGTGRCWDAAPGLTTQDDDFEFDSLNKRAVWQSRPVFADDGTVLTHGSVTIAPLDEDGNLVMDKRFECKECDPAPVSLSAAGPEFAQSGGRNYIYFSAMSEDSTSVRLGRLAEGPSGGWDLSYLPNSDGMLMVDVEGTPNDQRPKVLYRVINGDFRNVDAGFILLRFKTDHWGWRYDGPVPQDMILDQPQFVKDDEIAKRQVWTGRFFPDRENLAHIWVAPRTRADKLLNRIRYVPAVYDLSSNEDTLIYSSSGVQPELASVPNQLVRWPVVFAAPELGGATAILSVVNSPDKRHLAVVIWRQNDAGGWEEWSRIPAESVNPDYPCLFHPEGFAVNGRSYVVAEAYRAGACALNTVVTPTASIIWVASIDPDLPADQQVRRVVSTERNPARPSLKQDAEAAVFDGTKARIYYKDYKSFLKNISVYTVCDPGL